MKPIEVLERCLVVGWFVILTIWLMEFQNNQNATNEWQMRTNNRMMDCITNLLSTVKINPSVKLEIPESSIHIGKINSTYSTRPVTVFLNWDEVNEPDIAGYIVYIGTNTGDYYMVQAVPNKTNTQYVATLNYGQTCYFTVRSVTWRGAISEPSKEFKYAIK